MTSPSSRCCKATRSSELSTNPTLAARGLLEPGAVSPRSRSAMSGAIETIPVGSPFGALLPVFDKGYVAVVVDGDRVSRPDHAHRSPQPSPTASGLRCRTTTRAHAPRVSQPAQSMGDRSRMLRLARSSRRSSPRQRTSNLRRASAQAGNIPAPAIRPAPRSRRRSRSSKAGRQASPSHRDSRRRPLCSNSSIMARMSSPPMTFTAAPGGFSIACASAPPD